MKKSSVLMPVIAEMPNGDLRLVSSDQESVDLFESGAVDYSKCFLLKIHSEEDFARIGSIGN